MFVGGSAHVRAASPTLRDTERVAQMGEDERSAQQVHKVVDLLVRPAGYEVRVLGNLALAYKPDPDGEGAHRGDFDAVAGSNASLLSELAFGVVRTR